MKEWPRLFISHRKAIIIVRPRAVSSRADYKKDKVSSGTLSFLIDLSHLLVSFHFCLIFTEWKSLIQYMFLLVYLTCLKRPCHHAFLFTQLYTIVCT